MPIVETKDENWTRRVFYLPKLDRNPARMTPASQKFTDTSLGGNIAINSPPQFCEYADPMVHNMGGTRMGRYYSENIDDAAVNLHIRAGVPRYNSLTQFFIGSGGGFYDPKASYLARTGRARSVFYTAGQIGGFLFTAPLQPIIFLGRAVKTVFGVKPSSRWYNLKPTMHMYWGSVNMMVNSIAVNMGIVTPLFGDGGKYDGADGSLKPSDVAGAMHEINSRIFRKDGGIDMFAVATRAHRLQDKYQAQFEKDLKAMKDREAVIDSISSYMGDGAAYDNGDKDNTTNGTRPLQLEQPETESLDQYLTKYLGTADGQYNATPAEVEVKDGNKAIDAADEGAVETFPKDAPGGQKGYFGKVWSNFWASTSDAAEFVSFNVRSADSVSESVTNSAKESELAQTLNGMNSSGRTRNFSFAGGNVGDNVVFNALEGIGAGLKDMAVGALDSVALSGLAAFNGAAFVDIPKYWEDSSVTLPRMSYKMELRSPYGHPMARLQNEIIPMVMVLAMALPRATGKQSYTSPFIVEAYCQGRGQVRLGLIDSVTITRGVNNMAWSMNGEPRGIDVEFSILDLSSIMSMPMNSNPELFDDENAFTDYMATLGGLSLGDQIYGLRRLNIEMTRAITASRQKLSGDRIGMWAADTFVGRAISGFRPGVFYE